MGLVLNMWKFLRKLGFLTEKSRPLGVTRSSDDSSESFSNFSFELGGLKRILLHYIHPQAIRC